MRYVSLFSGIEAASVAAESLGWEPVCFCEIDEFPSAVLAHHYPEVPNLGDITKADWKGVIAEHGPVDLVVGGSPCQSFSVAGKREGLEGASGLMFEYIRAVSEILPRYWVWENVPGALSSSGGGDFKCFLREMAGIRGPGGERYGIGWRVLDAQFFGVAQRRRRLFAVGVLGDFGGPAEILFESEGLRWDTPSSREKRKALTTDARSRAANAGWAIPENVINRPTGGSNGSMAISGSSPTLRASNSVPATLAFAQNQRDEVRLLGGDGVSPTLASSTGEGMNIQPVVMASTHTNAEIGRGGVSPTLTAHNQKDAPVLVTETTCSPHSAQPMEASSSSITSQSEADGLYSTRGMGVGDRTWWS